MPTGSFQPTGAGSDNSNHVWFSPETAEVFDRLLRENSPVESAPITEQYHFQNLSEINRAATRGMDWIYSIEGDIQRRPDGTYTVRRIRQNARANRSPIYTNSRVQNIIEAFGSPPDIDKSTYTRLIKASEKLQAESNERARQMQSLRGKREGQYIKMLRNDRRKNMTFIEIVGSEVPVPMRELGWSKVKSILSTIRLHEVEDKGGGKYIIHCVGKGCTLKEFPVEYGYFCDNHIYCAEHVPDLKLCDVCANLFSKGKVVKSFDGKTFNACSNCINDPRGCRDCGNTVPVEYAQVRTCAKCIERGSGNGPLHTFSRGLKWTSKDKGSIVQSSRMYSSEVEALSPFPNHASMLFKVLPPEVGIATDGSVTANDGKAYGYELQTPRLAGKRGEELVQRMCAASKSVESSVNESCGMHVHIDGQGLIPLNRKEYPAALIQMFKAYLVFEDVLMSLVPYSRRNNDFCRRLSESFQVNELDTMETMVDIEKLWYKARTTQDIRSAKGQHYSATRYFGVNFHCLLNDGHFEIRFHPGTLNPKKVLEWANLHVLIADAAVRLSFDNAFLREARATYSLAEKSHLLFDLIGMSKASKDYLLSRQRKFSDKGSREDETKSNGDNNRGTVLTDNEN